MKTKLVVKKKYICTMGNLKKKITPKVPVSRAIEVFYTACKMNVYEILAAPKRICTFHKNDLRPTISCQSVNKKKTKHNGNHKEAENVSVAVRKCFP